MATTEPQLSIKKNSPLIFIITASFLSILGAVILIVLNTFESNKPLPDTPLVKENAVITDTSFNDTCQKMGGKFITEFNECENISEISCTELGGLFNECASPCRHDKENGICVQMCVPVCTL